MRKLVILASHLLVTVAKLCRPGGVRAVAAESLLLKQQLLISNRSKQRAPNLTALDRFVLRLTTLFLSRRRIEKVAALLSPATLFKFQKALIKRKYSLLISGRGHKPGPKGPSAELIAAIVELKVRNPRFGCVRIAQQISCASGIEIDKDVVRRVLAKHYRRGDSGSDGPSWLTFIAQTKDSLWSLDLFRCESILLRSHWVLLIQDLFIRCIVGFGIDRACLDGVFVCRIFNDAVLGQPLPKRISTDHDPLCRFHHWLANLRVLEIEKVETVPNVPVSHPYVERLIGTIRREFLDRTFFWNGVDLARKLGAFRDYYNEHRVHRALDGTTPATRTGAPSPIRAALNRYAWRSHCNGVFQTPVPA
jgi:transposase InsO family protein